MPIDIRDKDNFNIRAVYREALKDAREVGPAPVLHLKSDSSTGKLCFFAPRQQGAAPFNASLLLQLAVSNEIGQRVPSDMPPAWAQQGNLKIAEQVVTSVIREQKQPGQLADLLAMVKKTDAVIKAALALNARGERSGALHELKPLHAGMNSLEAERELFTAHGVDSALGPPVHTLVDQFATGGSQQLVHELQMKISIDVASAYAIAEQCGSILEAGSAPVHHLISLLCLADRHACEGIYLPAAALRVLDTGRKALGSGARNAFGNLFKILQANSKRYEAYLKSPISRAPGLQNVSRAFAVQMYERFTTGHAAEDDVGHPAQVASGARRDERYGPIDDLFASHLNLGDIGTADRLAEQGSTSWRIQFALSGHPPEPAVLAKVHEALIVVEDKDLHQIYAYEGTIRKLRNLASQAQTAGRDQQIVMNRKLAILELNAKRMEAFMRSSLSHNPAFDSVDRMLLIPWWEAVKDYLPPEPPPENGEGVDPHDVPDGKSAPEPGDAAPLHMHLAALAETPPELAPSPRSPVQALLQPAGGMVGVRPAAGSVAGPRATVRPVLETKTVAFEVGPPDLSAINRQGAAPTGRRHRDTDHHDRSKHKWLSRAERDGIGRVGKGARHLQAVNALRQ